MTTLEPQDHDAERAILGAVLLDRDSIALIADTLPFTAFAEGRNRIIYRAMLKLWDNRTPADYVTLTSFLAEHDAMDKAGGHSYLAELLTAVPTASHIEHYAGIVRKLASRRALISAGSDLVKAAYDGEVELDEAVSGIRAAAEPFAPPADEESAYGQLADLIDGHTAKVVDRWEGRLKEAITPTGIRSVDHLLMGGLRPGELVYVGGRPGSGKTSLALQIAAAAAKATGKTSLITELEMSPEALLNRLIASEARLPFGIAYQTIGGIDARNRWLETADRLRDIPVDIQALRTTDKLVAHAERSAGRNPIGLIVVDHQGLLSDRIKDDGIQARTAEISTRCKRIAMELQVPMIVVTQLNREVERQAPYIPSLKSLINSGATEANADHVWLLYRRKYYVDQGMLEADYAKDFVTASPLQTAELHVAKNRNGEAGTVPLGWAPESMSFHPAVAA